MYINALGKGEITHAIPALTASTATSNAIEALDKNYALLDIAITGTGTWNVSVTGALTKTGTYKNIYNASGDVVATGNITASRMQILACGAPYIKVVATEVDGTATIQVDVMPIV